MTDDRVPGTTHSAHSPAIAANTPVARRRRVTALPHFVGVTFRRAHLWTAALIILFGLWLRGGLYFAAPPLWLDETYWAERMLTEPLQSLYVRPVGFMWASLKIVNVMGYSELSLRLLPFLASCLTLPVFWLILRELITSTWVRLVGLMLCAIHPWFIDYGVEFKPYAVELFLHLLCVWFCLRELRKESSLLQLSLIFAVATAAFLLGYNIIFLYPAFFLTLIVILRRRRSIGLWSRERMGMLVTTVAACVGLILWIRSTALAEVVKYDESQFWASKYGVFVDQSNSTEISRVDWYVRKYVGLTSAPSLISEWGWGAIPIRAPLTYEVLAAIALLWLLLHFQGVRLLVHRERWLVLSLLITPTLTALIFNIAGKWPFGLFRTNVFLLGYFLILALLGLDAWVGQRRAAFGWAARALALALILPSTVVALQGRTEKGWSSLQTPKTLRLLATIDTGKDGSIPLYCDSYSCSSIDTYTRRHATHSKAYGPLLQSKYHLVRGFHVSDISRRLRRQTQGPAVIVIGRGSEIEEARAQLPSLCTKSTLYEEIKLPLVVYCVRGDAK